MATYVLKGYSASDFAILTPGAPSIGTKFRLDPDWSASTSALTYTITDDDATFDGSPSGQADATQTAVVTNAAGDTVASGAIRLAHGALSSDGDATTAHVYEIYVDNVFTGYVSQSPFEPGVTYQLTTYDPSGATGPGYASFVENSYEQSASTTIDGGAYDDSLHGGEGDDCITGGLGGDTMRGGSGADTIQGDDGRDLLFGDTGNDRLIGGSGQDTLDGGAGKDILFGDSGSDLFRITAGESADTVVGGDEGGDIDRLEFSTTGSFGGVNVMYYGAETGFYSIGGTSASFSEIEEITGTSAADTLNASMAGGSAVSLDGGGGADSITGGLGGDTLDGGAGADTLTGGGGDDGLTGGTGGDTFAFADGSGADTVTDFDSTVVDGKTVDQLDLSGMTNLDGDPLTREDVTVSEAGPGNTLLSFPNGESVLLMGVVPSSFATASDFAAAGIPCYAGGTWIRVPGGERLIETLRPGDLVETRDEGPMPVVWAGARHVTRQVLEQQPNMLPVRLRAGSVGNSADLTVSPQHCLLLRVGESELLVRARHLALEGRQGARIARGCRSVTYHHLLLDRHALLCANGTWAESLYPGPRALDWLDGAGRRSLYESRPELVRIALLRMDPVTVYGPLVRPLARRRDLRCGVRIAAVPAAAVQRRDAVICA